MDPAREAAVLFNRWRAFYPWPGAHTAFRGKKVLLHAVCPVSAEETALPLEGLSPGELVVAGEELLLLCGGMSALRLDELQVEGRRRMTAAEFMRGYQVKTGERLG